MFTIAIIALLAGSEYASVDAARIQLPRRSSSTPVALWGACNFPSQGINGPLPCADGSECICKDETYAQCREQVDGSWTPAGSSWECQNPGDSATGTIPSSSSPSSSTGDAGSKLTSGNNNLAADPGSANTSPTQQAASTPTTSSNGGGSSPAAAGGSSQSAAVGNCDSTTAPGGWDGVASTSYYGWMGSACDCGQNSWQWAHSPGIYNGAVNQKLFSGSINSAGQPNCGSACGTCYELSTSGFNAYNGGVASGSTLTIQIVDACYSAGDAWCGSTSDSFKDQSDCGVHFDIQTGAPGTAGEAAVGSDGTTWNDGGQIVYYRQTSCPSSLSSGYQSTCTCGH